MLLSVYRSDSVFLPESARDVNCQFRWWQPVHSGYHLDVWALDDVSLNDHLFNTLHVHMNNLVDIGEKLTMSQGRLSDSYCRKMKSIRYECSDTFLGEYPIALWLGIFVIG